MLDFGVRGSCSVLLAVSLIVAGCTSQGREVKGAESTAGSQSSTSATVAPAPPPTSTTQTQPETLDAAVAALQEKADRHASGDFAGEWLLFTKDLRDHVDQQTFVEYSQACISPVTQIKIKVSGGRMDGPGRAIVRQELLGVIKSATMVYEDGAWYKEPDEFLTSNYGKSSAEMVAADKAAGHCTT